MPRKVNVTFADGTTALVEDVPDTIHPNDVLTRVEKGTGKAVKSMTVEDASGWDTLKGYVKDVARGAGKAAAFLGEGAAAFNAAERGHEPPGQELTAAVEQALPTPKGDTAGRQVVRAGLEGAGGAYTGPGALSAPLRTGITGAMSGIGAYAGGKLTNGNPIGSFAGGLAGGGAVSAATAPKTTRQSLVNTTLEGVSDAELATAQKIMDEARKVGVNLNLSQAMPTASNIDKLAEILANSKNGREIVKGLRQQPTDVAFAMEGELNRLPGKIKEPQGVANSVQDAATANIKSVKEARTALVSPLYNNAGDLGPKAPQELARAIEQMIQQPGTSPKVVAEARKLQSELLQSSVDGKPRTKAVDIKAAIDSFRGGIKNQLNPLDPLEQGQMKHIVSDLYGSLGTKSPIIKTANTIYQDVTERVVDPLKKSVVGRMATTGGSQADREAVRSKVFSVLDAGSVPGAPTSEILTLERSLRNGKQPEVFQDAVKTWLATKVSEATAKTGGRPSEGVAANLERVLGGNDIKQQGLQDVLVGLARSQGLPDDALLPGMQNLMRYVASAARRPGKVSGVSTQDIEEASRNRITGGVGNFSAVQPIRQPFQAVDDWLNADAYGFMDKLLTTPEGVATLRKLGKTPIVSKGMTDTLSTFLATQAAQEPKD
jgi:hypothetical protein